MYFSKLLDSLRTARDPYGKGKPRDVLLNEWFMKHIDVPLEDVKIEPHPEIFVSSNYSLKQVLTSTLDALRWTIADKRGWTGPCKIMECR